MNRTKWSRARFADRPSNKRAKYDHGNKVAAQLILDKPNQHPAFMVQWALACRRRLAEESINGGRDKWQQTSLRFQTTALEVS